MFDKDPLDILFTCLRILVGAETFFKDLLQYFKLLQRSYKYNSSFGKYFFSKAPGN